MLYETNATGTLTAKNVWAETGLLARSTSTPNRTLLYTWDAQGNVSQQLDASTGSIVESYMFDAFGTRATNGSDTAAMNDPYAGFGGSRGYYKDTETGLLLLGHRYYDPTTGRFLNRDPISYMGGVNLYGYVGNSPLTEHDLSGLSPFDIIKKIKSLFDCFADLSKLIFQLSNNSPCSQGAWCQFVANCFIGVLCALLMEGLSLEPPMACLIGALCGLAHTAFDFACTAKHCHEEPTLPQVICSAGVNAAAGCAQGVLGAWGEEAKELIDLLLNGIGGNIGIGIVGAAGEGVCDMMFGKKEEPHSPH